MARNSDKIQLPTNTTDLSTLVRYLKIIKEKEPLNNNTAQPFYQQVKLAGKKKNAYASQVDSAEEKEPARDTHTTSTLRTYGLIRDTNKNRTPDFVVSELGKELIAMYNDEGLPVCNPDGDRLYSDEEYIDIILKVFCAWHETGKGRDIHPGQIILRLMTEEELEYYISEHDVAYFTSNPEFRLDNQYEEIKNYIIEFRKKYDGVYGFTSKPCKADIFMPTFVRNWKIFNKECIYDIRPNASAPGRFTFTLREVVSSLEEDEYDDEDSFGSEVIDDGGDDEAEVTSSDGDGESTDGVGTNIDLDKLYKVVTHYTLLPESAVYCGMLFGYKNKVEQTVYFGAPGTGKSHGIDKKMSEEKIDKKYQSRVIFHPDYTYGDFVGCLRPTKDGSSVDYVFIPGPLTKALKYAFENPREKIYLILEEINRGSAAAVFGDLFQLLDRDETGKSKYVIRNEDMCSAFRKSVLLRPFFSDGNVWFPSNLNILCTMNTADQNVFVLDSAFKRRFHMEYVPIDYDVFKKDDKLTPYLAETSVFEGSDDLKTMFAGTELQLVVNKLNAQAMLKRNWPTFATLVNATIDIVNKNEGDQISEDKKLGPFYVILDELNSKAKFSDKVLYYLKQDVFKYVDTYFNVSYQVLYKEYLDNQLDIFKLLIPGGNI